MASNFDSGIVSFQSSNNLIEHNHMESDRNGISLTYSSYNNLTNNTVNSNQWMGIFLSNLSNNNIITHNTAYDNFDGLILFYSSNNNTIIYNTANDNHEAGFGVVYSDNNILANNTANSNIRTCSDPECLAEAAGIFLSNSLNNKVINNTANSNNATCSGLGCTAKGYGIYLGYSSNNNEVKNNIINDNPYGIYLEFDSDYNDLIENKITKNSKTGVHFFTSDSNFNNLSENKICYNVLDVNDADANSGDENICDTTINYNDDGSSGCTFLCNPPPEINKIECQENNSIWQDCSDILYNDYLTAVRVNCTDADGIKSASLKLVNIPDNYEFFDSPAVQAGDYWLYDNVDILLKDSGEFDLTAYCTNNLDYVASQIDSWTVPFGALQSYLISPTADITVFKDQLFSFSSGVKCVGGECGNITAALDPETKILSPFDDQGELVFSKDNKKHLRVLHSNENELSFDFELAKIKLSKIKENDTVYDLLEIPDSGFSLEQGKPMLPVVSKGFAIPPGKKAKIKLEIIEEETLPGNYKIYPAQPPMPDTKGAARPPFTMDIDTYSKDEHYPINNVYIDSEGILRGINTAYIRVTPVKYNPLRKEVKVITKFRITTSFEKSKKFQFKKIPKSKYFEQMYSGIVNYDEISPMYLQAEASGSDYDFLIISHPDFLDAANKLADFRSTHMEVNVNSTSETGSTPDEIINFIKNEYSSSGISFVLIIGDHEFVPAKSSIVYTDLYYAAVDGADYYPDLFIGRIPVDTLDEANNIVDKIIMYETTPPVNPDFSESFAVAGYFQDYDDYDGYEDRRFIKTSEEIRDFLLNQSYNAQRIYYTESYITPTNYNNDLYANGESLPPDLLRPGFAWDGDKWDIIDAVDNGVVILNHRDHGAVSGWPDPAFNSNDLSNLQNIDLPVVFSMNCLTGRFVEEESFAEEFLLLDDRGAVGVVGATNVSYNGYNDWLTRGLYDAMWPEFDKNIPNTAPQYYLGAILNYGKEYMKGTWGDPWDLQQLEYELFHYFGDPAMKIKLPGKGIIPMNNGTPFYTITLNPMYPQDLPCLAYMDDGDSCNQTWIVNATGDVNTSYDFFTIYSPLYPTAGTQTPLVSITIINESGFSLNLLEGWNLISSPLNFTNLSEILQPILPQIDSMFMYDAQNQEFVEVDPETTTEINLLNGFWLNVNDTIILSIAGEPFDTIIMPLELGWNLVGHPSMQNQNVADTYSAYEVYSYNGTWSSYIPGRPFNPFTEMKPSYGYWVKSE